MNEDDEDDEDVDDDRDDEDSDDDDDDGDGHGEDGEMVIRMLMPRDLVGPSKGPTRMIVVGPFSVHWNFFTCL